MFATCACVLFLVWGLYSPYILAEGHISLWFTVHDQQCFELHVDDINNTEEGTFDELSEC